MLGDILNELTNVTLSARSRAAGVNGGSKRGKLSDISFLGTFQPQLLCFL